MKISGLNVDVDAIAKGVFDMIVDRGDRVILEHGMLPADIMNVLDGQMRDRFIRIAAVQHGIPYELAVKCVDEKKIGEVKGPVIRAISAGILGLAKA